jgi:hypothetical protein
MAKATEHEKILRVHEVYQRLIACWSTAAICQYSSEKWGVDDRTTHRYIAEARERLKSNCQVQQSEWIAQKLATLDFMAQAELREAEQSEAGGTNSRLAALQMIRTQAQLLKVL